MRRIAVFTAASFALLLGGCSSSNGGSNTGGSGGGGAGRTTTGSGGGGQTGGNDAGGGGTGGGVDPMKGPMKLISAGVPAFGANTDPGSMTASANDDNPASAWASNALPASLAYDLSKVPAAQRRQALAAWYAPAIEDYLIPTPAAGAKLPLDYVIETHAGAGGGMPPADGWKQVATVTDNQRGSRQHVFDLDGANWVRITVTRASDPSAVYIDFDVYSAPEGGSNDWLFTGDSITFISLPRAFSDLPWLVKDLTGEVPAVIDAAIGGTNTGTAMEIIDDELADFPGKYVTLDYGTNNHADDFDVEPLMQKIIAAKKLPVLPHMPWSDSADTAMKGPIINGKIDALLKKYPQAIAGPDLWKVFENRTDLIPSGDVHPNGDGQEVLRKAWADVMSKVVPD